MSTLPIYRAFLSGLVVSVSLASEHGYEHGAPHGHIHDALRDAAELAARGQGSAAREAGSDRLRQGARVGDG